MIVSRNKRRRIGPGRGRGRGGRRGAPARTWSQPRLPGPARLPDGVLDHVTIEAVGPPYRDPGGEQRAAVAIQ